MTKLHLKFRNKTGFTLLEIVLALTLTMVVLLPLTSAFKVMMESWDQGNESNELYSHGRMAMTRMLSDLRYAVILTQADTATLEFLTRNMEDAAWDAEKIRYWVAGDSNLYRQVDGLPAAGNLLAGGSSNIVVNEFLFSPMKKVAGGLLQLDIPGGDTLDMAEAVELTLRVSNTVTNESVSLTSMAKLRNK